MERLQERRNGTLKNNNPPCDLWSLPRCQAKAKSTGRRCGNIAIKGKRVCYIHGGRSSGPPKGNTNALKHGRYSEKTKKEKREMAATIEEMETLLKKINH